MDNQFPMTSPLLVPELCEQLKPLLDRLTSPVRLTCIPDGGGKSREMAAFLNHFASLHPMLTVEFFAPGENPDLDSRMDAALLPATGVGAPGELPRMIFHGIPGGKEISSFAAAVLNAGGAGKELDKYTLKDISRVKKPMELQVCVSLACHHCAQLVGAAQRVAWENPMVTAHMIDANLYPDLVKAYAIERVPLLIINRSQQVPGGKTLSELTTLLAKVK